MNRTLFKSLTIALSLCATASLCKADLIAYWPLDESEGDVAHDVIGGFDGTITGGNWVLPGKVGAAAYEGSGGNEINCGSAPSPTTHDLTLAWWMIDNQERWGTIMDKSVEGSRYGYNILVRPRNEDSPLRFRIGGWQETYGEWANECRVPTDAYNDGEWVHIVCTYDSATDTASIYVNGELPANGALNPKTGIAGPGGYCDGVNNVDAPLSIRGGQEGFDGVLDEVAIWDQALTAEEVMTVYLLGPLGLDASLPFAITAVEHDHEADAVTLTWRARSTASYIAKFSLDMEDWGADMGDGLTMAIHDENPDDGDHLTKTFQLADFGLQDFGDVYFRVEEE